MAFFFSSGLAPLPIHTKTAFPVSTMNTATGEGSDEGKYRRCKYYNQSTDRGRDKGADHCHTILGVKAALWKGQLPLVGQRHAHLSTFITQPACKKREQRANVPADKEISSTHQALPLTCTYVYTHAHMHPPTQVSTHN